MRRARAGTSVAVSPPPVPALVPRPARVGTARTALTKPGGPPCDMESLELDGWAEVVWPLWWTMPTIPGAEEVSVVREDWGSEAGGVDAIAAVGGYG